MRMAYVTRTHRGHGSGINQSNVELYTVYTAQCTLHSEHCTVGMHIDDESLRSQ